MPDTKSRFFELRETYGRDEAGNLEPLSSAAFAISLPVMTGSGKITEHTNVTHVEAADELTDELAGRFIPGTRIVETTNPLLAGAILGTGIYDEIDPPSKAAVARAVNETKAHITMRNERDRQVALGNEPAPDATDSNPAPQATGDAEHIPSTTEA
jgi:hypothetical protein